MKTRADDDAHMTLLRTRVDGVEVNAHATLRPDEMAKTRWGTAKATCNDKDWGPEAAFDAGVSDSAESSSSPCSCQAVVLALRAVIVSAAAWFAAVLVVCVVATGDTPLDIPPAMALLLALACLALYIFELRSRHQFWAVARPGGGSDGEAFAARIQMLRDAEPRVDLCYPGAPPVTYRIAEWRDETRPADPDGFLGAPRGLFLVSFPLQVFPGDPSEASALEFAQVQCAASACGAPTPGKLPLDECGPLCEDASKVAVVARLKWLDGSEIAEAAPQVLAEGHEAECLRPFLILSVPLLLGLVADSVLRVMLTPLAWPVRKRIFTIQGSNLGVLRFGFSTRGEVRIEGDEDDLRHANRFWLSEQDWRSLWSTSQEFAARVARFRRARLLACCGAGCQRWPRECSRAFRRSWPCWLHGAQQCARLCPEI